MTRLLVTALITALVTTLVGAALPAQAGAQPVAGELAGDHEVLAGDPVPGGGDPAPADTAAALATAPPAAASQPSSDRIDLSTLGLEPGAPAFDDKLGIYGFADVGYISDELNKDVPFYGNHTKSFLVGNLNLYLAKNLTAKARALAEVRFTFLPNGSPNADGSVVDTTALDLTNFGRPSQWGGIVIERAYAEYDVTDHLTVRAGHWLTPYGIWNIDHGSPTVVSTIRPYIIGEQFFPEHQTGLDGFGAWSEAGFKLGYHATVSNGRGAAEAQSDQDNKFAFGGRVELETPWGLKAGGSYYRGRYTGVATTAGALPDTYLEAAYGGDAQYNHGALHVQAEVIARDRHYTAGRRPAVAAGFAPDGRDFGFYVLAGYRFDVLWNVMPFAYYEDERPADQTYFSGVVDGNVGLNFRPVPSLVLKVMASYSRSEADVGILAGVSLREYTAQAAWVF
jgi:hypothetical protein